MLKRFNKTPTKKPALPSAAEVCPVPAPRAASLDSSENMPPTLPARRPSTVSETGRKQSEEEFSRNTDNEIKQLSYYHPQIKELAQIKQIMAPFTGRSGHFLLRDSFSKPGTYTVTVMHTSGIKHININTTPTTYYLKDTHFPTLSSLVDHYKTVSVPNQENVGQVMLRYPILRELVRNRHGMIEPISERDENNTLAYLTQPPEASSKPFVHIASKGKSGSSTEFDPYYSGTSRGTVPMADKLKQHISATEQAAASTERCECGLLLDDSQLPRGWSVHVSREPATNGRIFFLSSDGETRWELPMWIAVDLTPEQQDRLRDLLRKSDNHLTEMLNSRRTRVPPVGVSPAALAGRKKINDSSNYVSHDMKEDGARSNSASSSDGADLYTKPSGENRTEGAETEKPFGNSDLKGLTEPPKDRILVTNNNENAVVDGNGKKVQASRTNAASGAPVPNVRRSETLPASSKTLPASSKEHPHYMPMNKLMG